MGAFESTAVWEKIRSETAMMKTPNVQDVSSPRRVVKDVIIRDYLDSQVSPDDVVNPDAVMDDILSHPHRKHFATLSVPTEQDKREYEGIFSMGIPRNVLLSFGHWFRMSHPLEVAREKYMKCHLQNPEKEKCVDEAIAMYKLYLEVAEIPFRTCPKESADYTYCVETQGRYRKDSDMPGSRKLKNFQWYCQPEQQAWQGCMSKKFGVAFPPVPQWGRSYERSARHTNLPWDKVYS